MARLETSGLYSCAFVSIGHIGYEPDPTTDHPGKVTASPDDIAEVNRFSNEVLLPTRQPQGATYEFESFGALMEALKESDLSDKCVLISTSQTMRSLGWEKVLLKWRFKPFFEVDNSWGERNVLYMYAVESLNPVILGEK